MKKSFLFLLLFLLCTGVYGDVADDIESLTGNQTKIVWARSVTGISERDVSSANYALVGFNTNNNVERDIIPGPISCSNPLILSNGSRIVYTDWPKNKVCIINWNGSNQKVLLNGFALTVLKDENTNEEWVYVSEKPYGDTITRYQVDNVDKNELVWNKTKSSIRLSVSANGTRAGGEFPWNKAGIVTLPNKSFIQLGSGCNASIAPDNSYHFFHQVGTHKEIFFYKNGNNKEYVIPLNDAPGIDDHTVWIPRWSNDVRFITMSGPESNKKNKNNIYFGKFNSNFTAIEKWVQVTANPYAVEIYAHALICKDLQLLFSPEKLELTVDENEITIIEENIEVTIVNNPVSELSVNSDAQWLDVSVSSINGTVHTILNKVDPQNMPSGVYLASVIVSGDGILPHEYIVRLTIKAEPYLKSIQIIPCDMRIKLNEILQFYAQTTDQFKNEFPTPVTWETSGGGTIDQTGLFTNNGEIGNYVITAIADETPDIKGVANVYVYKNMGIYSPIKNDKYMINDSLYVRWEVDTTLATAVTIDFTPSGGKVWYSLNPESTIEVGNSNWGNFCWVIPDSIPVSTNDIKVPVISDMCKVKVTSYTNLSISARSEMFSIVDESDISIHNENDINNVKPMILQNFSSNSIITMSNAGTSFSLHIFSIKGAKLVKREGLNYYSLNKREIANGVYIIKLQTKKKTWTQLIHIQR